MSRLSLAREARYRVAACLLAGGSIVASMTARAQEGLEEVSGLQSDQPSDDSSTVASLKIEADLGSMLLTSISSYYH